MKEKSRHSPLYSMEERRASSNILFGTQRTRLWDVWSQFWEMVPLTRVLLLYKMLQQQKVCVCVSTMSASACFYEMRYICSHLFVITFSDRCFNNYIYLRIHSSTLHLSFCHFPMKGNESHHLFISCLIFPFDCREIVDHPYITEIPANSFRGITSEVLTV